MKKIWTYLKWHIINDFNPGQYASVGVFLAIAISLNYYFDFEDTQLEPMEGFPKFFAYFIFYSFPYFTAVFIYARFTNGRGVFSKKEFWLKSLFAIFILSLDSSVPYLDELVYAVFHPRAAFWGYKVTINAISFFTVLAPIIVFYFLYERDQHHLYGLNARKFDASPYFIMLLIMLPALVAVSFTDGFLKQYPMYKTSGAHQHFGVPEWVTVAGYELAYGLDFVTVEYFFRGFLVIGMIRMLGRGAVLPMAVLYCFLHFGKPAAEAISSIAGGYILGVVAYETKSIWGGVIIHMGIAWTMEAVAFIQKLFP
jgi:hypothetical protein